MDLQAKKEYIKSELDKVEDADLLEAIKNILNYGKSKNYEQDLYPMSKEKFYRRNEISRKAIEENALISQEEAKAYFTKKNVE